MSLKSSEKLDHEEVKFFSEFGWFTTLSVAIAALAAIGLWSVNCASCKITERNDFSIKFPPPGGNFSRFKQYFFTQHGVKKSIIGVRPQFSPLTPPLATATFIFRAIHPLQNRSRPDLKATCSGTNGDSPAAIKSAFTKIGQLASLRRNSRTNVVSDVTEILGFSS